LAEYDPLARNSLSTSARDLVGADLADAVEAQLAQRAADDFVSAMASTAPRLLYPTPYTAAPTTGANNLPWFIDFVHLSFWFYFLGLAVLAVWLVYVAVVVTRNHESRDPALETRGLSRAQTGDALTAVLPLTWSVTMLLQAGTYSTAFDEDVSTASLDVTITAYQ